MTARRTGLAPDRHAIRALLLPLALGGAACGGESDEGSASASGGAAPTAGSGAAGVTATGGVATGGTTSGGDGTGGAATGGVTSGGATSGGAPAGGATIGGESSGGNATGGGAPAGGDATGGAATGGDGGGGAPAGGATTGGASSGGAPAGGAMTGGATTGGTGGQSGELVTLYLSDLCASEGATNAWGPIERDLSNGEEAAGDGGPLTLGDQLFSKGLGMHAPAEIAYALGGACTSLAATVGVDDEMRDAGSVVFEVWGDGARLWESAALTGADPGLPLEVDVRGVAELRLVVGDAGGNGSDHADWADARVTCAGAPLPSCPRPPTEIPVPDGYHLVWSDEFEVEGRPDPESYSCEVGFTRNEELQWYQEQNAWVQAGFLVIEGRRERRENPNYQAGSSDWKLNREYAEYTSSSLHTRGKRSFQYGRFELRGRIVASAGLWPAWWSLGNEGEWPAGGEIDMMEYYGGALHANVACGTSERWVARWDSASRAVSSFGVEDWDAKFHVWRMDWDAEDIVLSVDGEELNTTHLDDMLNPDGSSPFRQPHYLLINLAIGGTAGGDPSSTAFPSRYEVDYVRVFQR